MFTAKWKQVKTYKATYSFKSTDKKYTLISSITGQLPSEKTGLKNGTKEKPADPEQKEFTVDEGIWKFKGWEPAEQTVNGKDISFVGNWEFTKKTS